MKIHTISPYQTTAEDFFTKLLDWDVDLVLDVRLHNTNQLAGFSKRDDLDYFVRTITKAKYIYDATFAPSQDILSPYLKKQMSWEDFYKAYGEELEKYKLVPQFLALYGSYKNIAIVGTGTKERHSHVVVLADAIEKAVSE